MAGTLELLTHDSVGSVRRAVIRATGDLADGTIPATGFDELGLGGISGALTRCVTNPSVAATVITLATSLAADDIIDTAAPHGFVAGTPVRFKTLVGGSAFEVGVIYYVVATSLGAQTFRVAATLGGAAMDIGSNITSGSVTADMFDAPSDNWDITAPDENGIDLFGGVLSNRDSSSTEDVALTGYVVQGERYVLTVEGTTVPGGRADIFLYWTASGSAAAGAAGVGGGDASAANQTTEIAHLSDIKAATEAILAAGLGGDASAANQATEIGHLSAIETATASGATAAHQVTQTGVLTTIDTDTGAMVTALQIIDNIVSGSEAQVDVVAALPAGTNNIGDVDVLTVPAPLSTTGGGTEATALRVTIATDSTGVVSIDDNGGAVTVDGTVSVTGVATAAKQDSQTALLTSMDADTSALAALISGGALVVSDPASGDASAANQDEQTALLTTIDEDTAILIGPIVAIDTAVDATNPSVVVGAIRDDALTTLTPAEGDAIGLRVNSVGALHVVNGGVSDATVDSITTVPDILPGATAFDIHYNNTAAAGGGSAAVVFDPPSGQCIVVTSLTISTYDTTAAKVILFFAADADATYTAGTDQPLEVVSFVPSATVSPGMTKDYTKPVKCLTADRQLKYQNTAAIDVDIVVHGYTYTP